MAYSRFTVENYTTEAKEYFRARSKRKEANSITECNSYFRETDSYLRQILSGIANQIRKGRIPHFDISSPSINVTPKGLLGKKCCDCPNDPVPYAKKNMHRRIGEAYLKEWEVRANQYLNNENVKPDIGASTRAPIVSKNPMA